MKFVEDKKNLWSMQMFCKASVKQHIFLISFIDESFTTMCMENPQDEENEMFLKFILRDFSNFLVDDRTIFDFTRETLMMDFEKNKENYFEYKPR